MQPTEKELDEIEELGKQLDLLFHNKKFRLVFGIATHRVGELGIHFNMPKDEFLKMAVNIISTVYDETMRDVKKGKFVPVLFGDNEVKKYDG